MKIERTLFWFSDGDTTLLSLNEAYFSLSVLLNRLINERYDGKRIKYLNIDFSTEDTYLLHPVLPKNEPYSYGGQLRFYGCFDYQRFLKTRAEDKMQFIWETACGFVKQAATKLRNPDLVAAAEYARKKGVELNFNADYKVIESQLVVCGRPLLAAIWIHFKPEGMYSRFALEDHDKMLISKDLDSTKNGIEFFLHMYKRIELAGNIIIVTGHKDVKYLPLKIHVDCDSILE